MISDDVIVQEEQRRAELMARVEPQTRQEDLEWEELEEGEIGELCGEVGRGEGEKGAKDENRSQEERDKNGGRKERDGELIFLMRIIIIMTIKMYVNIQTLYKCRHWLV